MISLNIQKSAGTKYRPNIYLSSGDDNGDVISLQDAVCSVCNWHDLI
jgi:hypothetical protein